MDPLSISSVSLTLIYGVCIEDLPQSELSYVSVHSPCRSSTNLGCWSALDVCLCKNLEASSVWFGVLGTAFCLSEVNPGRSTTAGIEDLLWWNFLYDGQGLVNLLFFFRSTSQYYRSHHIARNVVNQIPLLGTLRAGSGLVLKWSQTTLPFRQLCRHTGKRSGFIFSQCAHP